MKRDIDLIRRILLEVEASSIIDDKIELNIEDYSPEQVSYHALLLHEAGLIVAANNDPGFGEEEVWSPIRLTWHGHEFLDAARDEGRWGKVKKAMSKTGGLVISVAEQLLIEMAKDQAVKLLS